MSQRGDREELPERAGSFPDNGLQGLMSLEEL